MPKTFPAALAATAALAVAVALGGCGGGEAEETAAPVVLGAIYDLTGGQAALDLPSSRGAQLAVDEANRDGGVLGRPVRLALRDGESDPETVRRVTGELIDEEPSVAALFGLSDTDRVLAAAPVAAERGRVFVTSGATSPRLPEQVPEALFLACFGDNAQAAAGAEHAFEALGARSAVVLFDTSMTYTRLLHRYFEERFTDLGGEVLERREYEGSGLEEAVDGLPEADLVYLAAGPRDVEEGVRWLRRAGVRAPILGGDSFDLPEVWRRHPEIGGVFFTTHAALGPDATDPRVQAFREAYAAAHDGEEPDAFAALGYDTARLLLRAIADAGTPEPEAVGRALAEVEGFVGVTGSLGYGDGRRVPRKSVTVLEVASGGSRLAARLVPDDVPEP